jgi:hypothetical protein
MLRELGSDIPKIVQSIESSVEVVRKEIIEAEQQLANTSRLCRTDLCNRTGAQQFVRSLPSGPSLYGFVPCQLAKSLPLGQVDKQGASENSKGKLSIAVESRTARNGFVLRLEFQFYPGQSAV